MRTKTVLLAVLAAAFLTVISAGAQPPAPPAIAMVPEMPKQTSRTGKHVNRVIDMWLKEQPVYYSQTRLMIEASRIRSPRASRASRRALAATARRPTRRDCGA
jgi:hypothetical protein